MTNDEHSNPYGELFSYNSPGAGNPSAWHGGYFDKNGQFHPLPPGWSTDPYGNPIDPNGIPGDPNAGGAGGGGGGGGGGVPGGNTGGNVPNTGGFLGGSGLDWVKFLAGIYAMFANDPKFKPVPEDPNLIALRQRMLGYIDNSPTRNMLGDMLKARMTQTANSPYHLPPGANGYAPYQGGGTQPPYDLNAMFGNIASSGNTKPTGT